jgi:hypothetical protein
MQKLILGRISGDKNQFLSPLKGGIDFLGNIWRRK